MTANGCEFFCDDENALKLTVIMVSQLCEHAKTHKLYNLKCEF